MRALVFKFQVVAMMRERSIGLAHTTILRWVQHYTPEFTKRWKRCGRAVGGSWRMDETYVKVRACTCIVRSTSLGRPSIST
jgi:transposase-like protein